MLLLLVTLQLLLPPAILVRCQIVEKKQQLDDVCGQETVFYNLVFSADSQFRLLGLVGPVWRVQP